MKRLRWSEEPWGCWVWSGARRRTRRGVYGVVGERAAHRVVYELFTGRKLERGMVLHHLCQNKLCVNPEHLRPMPNGLHAQLHNPREWPLVGDVLPCAPPEVAHLCVPTPERAREIVRANSERTTEERAESIRIHRAYSLN
jgi:hypothetical protein